MKTAKTTDRRKFLLAAGLGTAAVAAVATVRQKAQKPAEATPQAGAGDGYRVSEHILKYYKTTEV